MRGPRYCSGLLGRTPLRLRTSRWTRVGGWLLFRSSRPDSIETLLRFAFPLAKGKNCSGLLGRTPLRLVLLPWVGLGVAYCSGLLGRTPLRQGRGSQPDYVAPVLFRSSRPDSIETSQLWHLNARQGGLFRSSRPDSIETRLCR